MAEHIWGPPFSQYSKRKFMPHESRVSQDDAEKFFKIHGVPPPSITENSLYLLGAGAELPDPTDLQSTILALWKYMVATKEKSYSILKHYYGFLYIRLLIHLTCVTVLRETGALERTPGILRPNSTHKDIFQAVAFLALDIAGKASANPTSLTEFCEIFACPSFLSDKAARGLLSSIIIPEIWGERDMFLKLCANGLLPGCSLFFLATHSVLSHEPGITSVNILYLHLQDLGLRLYLAGSHRDREILLPVCMTAIEKLLRWPTDSNRFLHAEDSRTLFQSYSGLLFVWQQDGRSAKTLPIGFIGHLVAFVLHMSGFNPSATPREHIETERTALRFLWLIFEHRGRIPAAEHSYLRYSAVPTFSYLWFIQKCISTQAEQYEFARMLTDVEVIGLAGRILLLIMAEEGAIWLHIVARIVNARTGHSELRSHTG
ncbi:hypothetical protein FS749_007558 [Ceratobasidium sp. UAMH 11750]|nr:hypothetical protein FS749_007558 [Ceratobasidium sp. UAMH 11750]